MKTSIEGATATLTATGILLLLPITSTWGAVVVVPGSVENVEANAGNLAPFHIQQAQIPSMRYQQVYAATEFSALDPGGGFITEIFFRPDGMSSGTGVDIREIQINLSTTQRGPDSLSPFFVENVGGNDTVVYGPGPLVTLSGPPLSFNFWVILQQPFQDDPAQGNLLLDIRNISPSAFDAQHSPALDAQNLAGDAVSRVWAPSADATMGTVDTVGLVAEFNIRPIPEPAPLVLGLFGVAVGAATSRGAIFRRGRSRR